MSNSKFYVTQYGYYWSMTKEDFIKLLQQGASGKHPDLGNYRLIKQKPSSDNIYTILDWSKEDFRWELQQLTATETSKSIETIEELKAALEAGKGTKLQELDDFEINLLKKFDEAVSYYEVGVSYNGILWHWFRFDVINGKIESYKSFDHSYCRNTGKITKGVMRCIKLKQGLDKNLGIKFFWQY